MVGLKRWHAYQNPGVCNSDPPSFLSFHPWPLSLSNVHQSSARPCMLPLALFQEGGGAGGWLGTLVLQADEQGTHSPALTQTGIGGEDHTKKPP